MSSIIETTPILPTSSEILRQQTDDLHQSLLMTGAPEVCTVLQAAAALAKIGGPADIAWFEEQLSFRLIPVSGRWPWSLKTVRLQDLARRVVVDSHDH